MQVLEAKLTALGVTRETVTCGTSAPAPAPAPESPLPDAAGFSGVGGVQSDRSARERTRSILESDVEVLKEEEDDLETWR